MVSYTALLQDYEYEVVLSLYLLKSIFTTKNQKTGKLYVVLRQYFKGILYEI